jgi:hypothetical protein
MSEIPLPTVFIAEYALALEHQALQNNSTVLISQTMNPGESDSNVLSLSKIRSGEFTSMGLISEIGIFAPACFIALKSLP